MSYTFSWEVPDRVGYFDFGETYSLEDADHLNTQLLEMLNRSSQPLHVMVDITVLEHFPLRMNENIWAMAGWMRHSKLGWLFIINQGRNPMANLLVSAVGKTIGVKTRFVKSREEAHEAVIRLDLSLQVV